MKLLADEAGAGVEAGAETLGDEDDEAAPAGVAELAAA